MKGHIKLILLIAVFISFYNCSSTSTKTDPKKCLLSDTIINKVTFGISKKEFFKFISNQENNFLTLGENKFRLYFKPSFYSEKLFSLSVDINDPEFNKPLIKKIVSKPNGNENVIKLNVRDTLLLKEFERQNNERDLETKLEEINRQNCFLYEKLLDVYVKKYGVPTILESSGRKGSWNTKKFSFSYIEYMDFEIHKKYEWSCSSKKIIIEFDIHAAINSELAKSTKTEEEILRNESYQVINYINFNVLYENLQLKSQHDKATINKIQSNMRIEDSVRKANDKKLNENI